MTKFDGWRYISVDDNVAAIQYLQSVLVELHYTFTRLAKRLHRRVEHDGVVLAVTQEFHLIEADVRHLRIASLKHRFAAVGLEVSTDLPRLIRGRTSGCH